jgi:DNA-directed RNA polymerase specialized sigma24 family protein
VAAEESASDRGDNGASSGGFSTASGGSAEDVARWLSRAATGDHDAWANLVDRFAPAVWAATRSETSDPAVSSDAVQTTWLRFADRLAQDKGHDRCESWLVETARREVVRSSALRGLRPAAT